MFARPGSIVLAAAASLVGCSPSAPSGRVVADTALLVDRSDTAEFVVPDSVRAGEPFAAVVTLFAGGCAREIARNDVRVRGDTAEIRPYVRRVVAQSCTADLLYLQDRVQLRFDAPGAAVVRVVGLRSGPPSDSSGRAYTAPARLERRVVVLPAAR